MVKKPHSVSIRQQHVIVLGLGKSGVAAAELALLQRAAVTVLDTAHSAELEERAGLLRSKGATVFLDWNGDPALTGDLVILSPGIPAASSLGQIAEQTVSPVVSELEFGFRYCNCPVLAVTGTNGKTTTVELLTHLLKGCGLNVIAAGNIGLPLCDASRKSADLDCLVVEVSSFQLERIKTFAPLGAALLNLAEDHLDRYPDFDSYCRTKMKLFDNMSMAEHAVLPEELRAHPLVAEHPLFEGQRRPLFFSSVPSTDADFFLNAAGMLCHRTDGSVRELLHRSSLKLRGRHNIENVLAALALAHTFGADLNKAAAAVRTFAPSAHRLELVGMAKNVQYINDSKATNPHAMIKALEAVGPEIRGKIVLIAGGLNKDLGFECCIPSLQKYVKEIFVIGSCKQQLVNLWKNVISCRMCASMEAAVDAAADAAEPGDAILLSPGCASQDMFLNYAERGKIFTQLALRRINE